MTLTTRRFTVEIFRGSHCYVKVGRYEFYLNLPRERGEDRIRGGSRRCFSSGFNIRASSDNIFAVIPVYGVWSAISVVAGARNQLPANKPVEFRFKIRL